MLTRNKKQGEYISSKEPYKISKDRKERVAVIFNHEIYKRPFKHAPAPKRVGTFLVCLPGTTLELLLSVS